MLLFLRLASLALCLAAGARSAIIRSAKDTPIAPIYPIGAKNESFAKAVGTLFEIDGKVQYFAGTNAWWLGHLTSNKDVDIAMQQIADTKYKIIRVWGFGDVKTPPDSTAMDPFKVWYQLHNRTGTYINYDADGLQRLDYVVSTAERLGLKLVLPFMNNWPALGGIGLYADIYGHQPWFYENKKSQEVYTDYIKILVNRYKSSPAIFSWQLGNEPRCSGCEPSVLHQWVNKTSRFIKSLDPHHMVSVGDEGWFAESSGYADQNNYTTVAYDTNDGVDTISYLNISTIDYSTFHLYSNTWGYPFDWGHLWIRQHADLARRFGKPVVMEEYGSPEKKDHTPVAGWQDTILKVNLASDQLWQFGPANLSSGIDRERLDSDEGFIVYYDHPEHQLLGRKHAQAMLDKKV